MLVHDMTTFDPKSKNPRNYKTFMTRVIEMWNIITLIPVYQFPQSQCIPSPPPIPNLSRYPKSQVFSMSVESCNCEVQCVTIDCDSCDVSQTSPLPLYFPHLNPPNPSHTTAYHILHQKSQINSNSIGKIVEY